MTRISQKSRDDLVSMLDIERSGLRCDIMKELHAEADEIKFPFSAKMMSIQKEIDALCDKKEAVKAERTQALSESMLLVFDERDRYASCPISDLHPNLQEFDAETNRLKKEIIML